MVDCVQCEVCKEWLHTFCIGIEASLEEHMCKYCALNSLSKINIFYLPQMADTYFNSKGLLYSCLNERQICSLSKTKHLSIF